MTKHQQSVLLLRTILANMLAAEKRVNLNIKILSIPTIHRFHFAAIQYRNVETDHISRKFKITQGILKMSALSLFNYATVTGNESQCSKCRLVWRTRRLQADNITGERYRIAGWNERDLNRYAKQGLIVIYTCMESTHTKTDIANR